MEITSRERKDRELAIHHRTCNLCEAMCGIVIEHDGQSVAAIRPDPDDPSGRGHICPKAVALADLHTDPDRLRSPMRRRGRDFEPLGWTQALDEVAARLQEIRHKHGRHSVALYLGNPTVHSYGTLLYGGLVLPRVLRTRSRYTATSVDQLPRMLASLLMYGHQLMMPIPDIDRTDYLLVLGANPLASNGSIMTAPDIGTRLKALRARGGKLVVLDPRRTETAALADEHHFLVPGSDAYFLLGLLHTLFHEQRIRTGHLGAHLDGLGQVAALAARYSPERVAGAVGIAAEDIRRLARELAAAPTAVCYGRVGTCLQEFGGVATWLVDLVNLLTGNLDRPGGAMFTTPAADLVQLASISGEAGHFGRWRSRVRGLPEFGGELPVATLAEEIETPGEGQIRALITIAGNPVLSTPNGQRLDRALAGLELMVSVDPYLNETTRHAHYVLPGTSSLERDHYDLALHLLAIRNTARYSPQLFTPPEGALHDWQILLELTARLASTGALGSLKGRLARALGRTLTPRRVVDLMLRLGPHGAWSKPFSGGVSMRKLEQSPHGIDLGPLQPRLPARLNTPDRRVRLAPREFLADLERLDARLAESLAARSTSVPPHQLLLIGRRQLRGNNSWMHNSERLVRGRRLCTLLMHPRDARARGLEEGQAVQIRSRVGTVEAPLEISSDMMPGVVSLPHGWGHGRDGVRLGVASRRPGVSINDLTDESFVDRMSGNAALNGVPVTVSAVSAAPTEPPADHAAVATLEPQPIP